MSSVLVGDQIFAIALHELFYLTTSGWCRKTSLLLHAK